MSKTPQKRAGRESDEVDTPAVSVRPGKLSIERPALYVVATPIGNRADFAPRAVDVLAAVDTILCEDTRHSRRLLDEHGIGVPLRPYHDHNERRSVAALLARLGAGEALALISDAGTPLISDPGYVLVAAAGAAGVPVIAIPGPSAVTAALSVSGLPTDRFAFEGFLPAGAAARRGRLATLAGEPRTLVFYEAPHRVAATLADLRGAFGGGRAAALARELTKRHETVYRGSLDELAARVAADADAARGEIVLVVAGAPAAEDAAAGVEVDRLLRAVLAETDARTALRIALAVTRLPRNQLYRRLLELQDED